MSKRANNTLKWMMVISIGVAVVAGAIHTAYNPGGLKFADSENSRVETVYTASASDSSGR